MSEFERDIQLALEATPNWDKVNAEIIGDMHGADPAYVLKLMKREREAK